MKAVHGERERVLAEVAEQLERLACTDFARLIPEVGSNLGYALPEPANYRDVAAVPGRIRNAMGKPAFLPPRFGASTHVASIIMAAMAHDPEKRCALNIRYSEDIIKALESMGLSVVFVDRMREPGDVAGKEGASVPWVLKEAVGKAGDGKVPDVIYHKGCVGKEAITQLLGRNPEEVVDMALQLL
jgi:predicted fused transcriptional regulator/phosphomethylpyrimidine kinase